MTTCPRCGGELTLITNLRFDLRRELVPICPVCKTAFRDPKLGWELPDVGEKLE